MGSSRPRAIAVVANLFDSVRMTETALRQGVDMVVVKPEEVLDACRKDPPALVLLDLEAAAGVLPDLLAKDAVPEPLHVVGFYPHVRRDLRESAMEAGLEKPLPRSAFFDRLPALLAEAAGVARLSATRVPHDHRHHETMPETREPAAPDDRPSERTRISCPGCGRHDQVIWPADRAVYHWKCFNCGKEFDLTRGGGH